MNRSIIGILISLSAGVISCENAVIERHVLNLPSEPYVIILGVAQDAGFPQAGCKKECCRNAFRDKSIRKMVSCIALVDPVSKQRWIFDATPDIKDQLFLLDSIAPYEKLDGIFLTHAHMGHYTGLLHLGREVMNTKMVPVYVNPDMNEFLQSHLPWEQLIRLENIDLQPLKYDTIVKLNDRISVQPFLVPHRAEISETFGYRIIMDGKKVIFIPDIDKWEKWDTDIRELVKESDLLFLDATFFKDGELPGRNMKEIPHPFVEESMKLFDGLSATERKKIHFIHFNHTNPLLNDSSDACKQVRTAGFSVAEEGKIY